MEYGRPPSRIRQYRLITLQKATRNSLVYIGAIPSSYEKRILKFIPLESATEERIEAECGIQSDISHPYVMQIIESFDVSNFKVIVMPRAVCGSLSDVVMNRKIPNPHAHSILLFRMLESLQCLHGMSILHGDIKPENFVLKDDNYENPCPQLIDFGHACYIKDHCTCNLMTFTYSAPEVLHGMPHSFPSDIWALGLTFYFIITQREVMHLKEINEMQFDAEHLKLDFSDRIWEELPHLPELIRDMTHPLPENRVKVEEALYSEFFMHILGKDWISHEFQSVIPSTANRSVDDALDSWDTSFEVGGS